MDWWWSLRPSSPRRSWCRDECLKDLNDNKMGIEAKSRDKATSEEELEAYTKELESIETTLKVLAGPQIGGRGGQ